MDEESKKPKPTPFDARTIRRRRRWLIAYSLLGVAAIVSVAVVQLLAGDEAERARNRSLSGADRPVVLERFDLKSKNGSNGQGIAEFIRRSDKTYLRMIAGDLRRTYGDQIYQAQLARRGDSQALGGQPVEKGGVFLGEKRIEADELHAFDRIELRLIGSGLSEEGKLVLSGKIPG